MKEKDQGKPIDGTTRSKVGAGSSPKPKRGDGVADLLAKQLIAEINYERENKKNLKYSEAKKQNDNYYYAVTKSGRPTRRRFRTESQYERSDIDRSKGLDQLIAEQIMSGKSVGSAVKSGMSKRVQASVMALKKMADPISLLNKVPLVGKSLAASYGMKRGRGADVTYLTGVQSPMDELGEEETPSKSGGSRGVNQTATPIRKSSGKETPLSVLRDIRGMLHSMLNIQLKDAKRRDIEANFAEEAAAERKKLLAAMSKMGKGGAAGKMGEGKEGGSLLDLLGNLAGLGLAWKWLKKGWGWLKKGFGFVFRYLGKALPFLSGFLKKLPGVSRLLSKMGPFLTKFTKYIKGALPFLSRLGFLGKAFRFLGGPWGIALGALGFGADALMSGDGDTDKTKREANQNMAIPDDSKEDKKKSSGKEKAKPKPKARPKPRGRPPRVRPPTPKPSGPGIGSLGMARILTGTGLMLYSEDVGAGSDIVPEEGSREAKALEAFRKKQEQEIKAKEAKDKAQEAKKKAEEQTEKKEGKKYSAIGEKAMEQKSIIKPFVKADEEQKKSAEKVKKYEETTTESYDIEVSTREVESHPNYKKHLAEAMEIRGKKSVKDLNSFEIQDVKNDAFRATVADIAQERNLIKRVTTTEGDPSLKKVDNEIKDAAEKKETTKKVKEKSYFDAEKKETTKKVKEKSYFDRMSEVMNMSVSDVFNRGTKDKKVEKKVGQKAGEQAVKQEDKEPTSRMYDSSQQERINDPAYQYILKEHMDFVDPKDPSSKQAAVTAADVEYGQLPLVEKSKVEEKTKEKTKATAAKQKDEGPSWWDKFVKVMNSPVSSLFSSDKEDTAKKEFKKPSWAMSGKERKKHDEKLAKQHEEYKRRQAEDAGQDPRYNKILKEEMEFADPKDPTSVRAAQEAARMRYEELPQAVPVKNQKSAPQPMATKDESEKFQAKLVPQSNPISSRMNESVKENVALTQDQKQGQGNVNINAPTTTVVNNKSSTNSGGSKGGNGIRNDVPILQKLQWQSLKW